MIEDHNLNLSANNPKVSVVTAVYNGSTYVDRAIPSILNQNFSNFEWIIVDDGSTDTTPELLKDLEDKDQRIRILSPGRLGFAKALNYAIANAKGKYIARQDFDDISYPHRLKLQVEFLDVHSEVGIVGCNYVVNDENRQEKYIRIVPTDHFQITNLMAQCVPFAHTLVTFRKETWLQSGGYTEPNNQVDIRLWIKFAKLGWSFGSIPEPLGEHFVYSNSFWHQNFQYSQRQKYLAKIQWQAIQELKLPLWKFIYPVGRYVYCYSPHKLKLFIRRTLAGSKEQDLM
jgi:glycosyltransferase EpsE